MLDAVGRRLVRINPADGMVSNLVIGLPTSVRSACGAGIDTTPDGKQIFITAGAILTLTRVDK